MFNCDRELPLNYEDFFRSQQRPMGYIARLIGGLATNLNPALNQLFSTPELYRGHLNHPSISDDFDHEPL